MISGLGFLVLFIALAYMVLLLLFLGALLLRWRHKAEKLPVSLSIVVPFRNEKPALRAALGRFERLLQCTPQVEVTFVNDHSTDFSLSELDMLFHGKNVRLISLDKYDNQGKKQALLRGVRDASFPWVLTVDIDTEINGRILRALLSDPPTESSCTIIPIKPRKSKKLISKMFDLEFMVLQAVGAGSVLLGRPLLANGACFLVNREVYLQAAKDRTDWDIPGGDDIFAMFGMAQAAGAGPVSVYIPREPLAEVRFPPDAASLFLQRVRWIAKTPRVKNTWYTITAWLVLFTNVIYVVLLSASMVIDVFHIAWMYFCLKWIAEFALITWGVLYFRRSDAWLLAIPGLLIYPFYLCALVIAAVSIKPKWKE